MKAMKFPDAQKAYLFKQRVDAALATEICREDEFAVAECTERTGGSIDFVSVNDIDVNGSGEAGTDSDGPA